MANKYLDAAGLSHAWTKIKEWLGGGSINVAGTLNISNNSIIIRATQGYASLVINNYNSLNFASGRFTWASATSEESATNSMKIEIDKDFAFATVSAGYEVIYIMQYFGMALVYFDAGKSSNECYFNNDLSVSIRLYAIKMTGTSTPTFQFLQTITANDSYKLQSQNNELYLVFWCSVRS